MKRDWKLTAAVQARNPATGRYTVVGQFETPAGMVHKALVKEAPKMYRYVNVWDRPFGNQGGMRDWITVNAGRPRMKRFQGFPIRIVCALKIQNL